MTLKDHQQTNQTTQLAATDDTKIVEIASGVYSIGQPQGGHVHAFLIDTGIDLILIDTLWDSDGDRIRRHIQRIGREISDLKHIILTHGHRSHLGGAATLKRISGASVYAHEWEADIVSGDRKAQGTGVTFFPMRPILPYLRVYPLQAGVALGLGKHIPCAVDHMITSGDRIGPLHVYHLPGHSPGHLTFYWPERHILFAGDNIATWPVLDAGWPALNLNKKAFCHSLKQMAEFDTEMVAVGHGEPIVANGAQKIQILAAKTCRRML